MRFRFLDASVLKLESEAREASDGREDEMELRPEPNGSSWAVSCGKGVGPPGGLAEASPAGLAGFGLGERIDGMVGGVRGAASQMQSRQNTSHCGHMASSLHVKGVACRPPSKELGGDKR